MYQASLYILEKNIRTKQSLGSWVLWSNGGTDNRHYLRVCSSEDGVDGVVCLLEEGFAEDWT